MGINKKLLAVAMSCLLITACGSDSSSPVTSGVTYTGSTTPATITAANAGSLANSAAKGPVKGQVVAAGAIANASTMNVRNLADIVIGAGQQGSNVSVNVAVGAIQAINNTVNGAATGGSGTAIATGSFDDVTGYGTATAVFNQFDDGSGTLMNGSLSFVSNASGRNITFTSFSIKDATGTFNMGGVIKTTQVKDGAGNVTSDTATMNFVVSDNTGYQVKLQNFVLIQTYDTTGQVTSESISGRFYDSVEGHLDITTTSPLIYSPAGSANPSSGGPLIAVGANNTKVKMTPIDGLNVLIEADTTGDGNYNYSAQKAWSAL